MQILQITSPGHFEIKDVPVPEPGPQEVLVKILTVTTCPHWDMHIYDGIEMLPGNPLEYPYTIGQPGHEACGDIVAVGKEVHEVSVGQRVALWHDRGHNVQGCYAQFVCADVSSVITVPADLPPEACAPLELAMCVSAHVLFAEKLDLVSGRTVGVFGLGPAGLVFTQLLKAAGADSVVGFDPLPDRGEIALALGADLVLNPLEEESADLPKRHQAGCFDTAFDCVGSPSAVHQAMTMTNNLIVLFAVQREPYVFSPACWGGLILAGAQRHTREAAEYAATRLQQGTLDLGALVTRTMSLQEYGHAVEMLKQREAFKVAFLPNGKISRRNPSAEAKR